MRYIVSVLMTGLFFAGNITAATCVDNLCVEGNVLHATAYKAKLAVDNYVQVSFGETVPYIAVDDPNGDVIQPGFYIVPENGYYSFTFSMGNVGIQGLSLQSVISLRVMRNGTLLQGYDYLHSPFVQSNKFVSGVVQLNAGDVISSEIHGFLIEPFGLVPATGIVILSGFGSFFTIHYLSSNSVSCCQ